MDIFQLAISTQAVDVVYAKRNCGLCRKTTFLSAAGFVDVNRAKERSAVSLIPCKLDRRNRFCDRRLRHPYHIDFGRFFFILL